MQATARKKKHPPEWLANAPNARLPDGARFELSYEEGAGWSGTLTIPPSEDHPHLKFTDKAGAVFTLAHRLDRQYRRAVKAMAAETAEARQP
jgi:hypothetical protein